MKTTRVFLLFTLLSGVAVADPGSWGQDSSETPTLELLEFLAEFSEPADGRWLDPFDLERLPSDRDAQNDYRTGVPR